MVIVVVRVSVLWLGSGGNENMISGLVFRVYSSVRLGLGLK
jgi:hypothetical protein